MKCKIILVIFKNICYNIIEEKEGALKMKRFLVKIISKATENNPYFAGQECVAYHGKNQKLLGYEGSYVEAVNMVKKLDVYMIKEYGYTRECDAKRSWCYKNPENSKYWTSTCEVVEFEIN